MRSKTCTRLLGVLALIGVLLWLLTSCKGRGAEPEQSYLVSAMGFDSSELGICVTIEIPVIREGNSEDAKTIVFSETAPSVEEALARMQREVPRDLVFSHCALVVLGEGLSRGQMQEIFAFAESGERLPLAAEVVRSVNAEELLRAGSLSAPAVGYEIPELLACERERMGVDMRCSLYELHATASPDSPVAIPRMAVVMVGDRFGARLCGLDILRPHADAVCLSAEDWVPYAILSNRFSGGSATAQRIRGMTRVLTVEPDDKGVSLSLNLKMNLTGGTENDAQKLRRDLVTRTEELFAYARDVVGEDLFLLGEQIKRKNAMFSGVDQTWIRGATLSVKCEIEGRRGM